jgi:hypothetical protein
VWWVDVNQGPNTLHVAQQIVQIDWETFITPPKAEAGERDVAIGDRTVAILKIHRKEQTKARFAAGGTGLIRGWCSLARTAPSCTRSESG